jgi:ElaB/YqjD/DUF883 family membrane-anchored ribosome-binding protein
MGIEVLAAKIKKLLVTKLDEVLSSRAAASDARFNNLDSNLSSRLPTNDSRLNNLDAAMSSRSPALTALTNATWTDGRAVKLDSIGASVINSIQRGQVDITSAPTTNVTISAVNLAKSVMFLTYRYAIGGSTPSVTGHIMNSTTVRITAKDTNTYKTVTWEVIEFQ